MMQHVLLLLLTSTIGVAQNITVALNSATTTPGKTASLNLQLNAPAGRSPAAIEWTVNAPTPDVQSITATLGPAAAGASKSIYCSGKTCLIAGMNASAIGNGTVAVLTIQLSGTAQGNLAVQLSNTMAVSPLAAVLPVTSVGGVVSVNSPPAVSISLSPTSITLAKSQTQQFSPSITGTTNNTVTWSVSPQIGQLSASGLYTAPSTISSSSTVTITATSNSAPTKSARSLVNLSPTLLSPKAISTSSSATITWTTEKASDSQVAYGMTSTYGSTSLLATAMVTAHSVTISGLVPSTTYHYKVMSHDSQGNASSSGDSSFRTSASPANSQSLLVIHASSSEVKAVTNGSIVTPSVAPGGLTGTVITHGTGSVNFAPAQSGNGVYFLNCCSNTNNAYFKFTGSALGNIFNVKHGQISFYLKSRYSFAQRKADAASMRYAFDVRDGNTSNHLFNFLTEVTSGYLQFSYTVAGQSQYYFVPKGTEDSLFGNGIVLKVTLAWDGNTISLYLDNTLVKATSYTVPTTSWTSASTFDLGAYEYLTFGGYDVSEDIIAEFTVLP